MDRHMRKAILSRARYDWEAHQATRLRNAEQIASIPTPEFPATGTARISALLTEARRRRDEAFLDGAGDGAGGLRTGTPLDNANKAVRGLAPRRASRHDVVSDVGLDRSRA
jgi:hypothetical protein